VGRWIIPCLEAPDGTIVQDGADIIDHFEKGAGQSLRRFSAYPESPMLLAISHLFELFGGEGLLRPAMYYRWNFDDENLAFLTSEFALLAPGSMAAEDAERVFLRSSGRMRKAAVMCGVTPESAPAIEAAFHEWLELFSAHLVDRPYLLGGQPTIGDFGLIAAMWAHLFRDPKPQALLKRHVPRVGRWVERMITSSRRPRRSASRAGRLPSGRPRAFAGPSYAAPRRTRAPPRGLGPARECELTASRREGVERSRSRWRQTARFGVGISSCDHGSSSVLANIQ